MNCQAFLIVTGALALSGCERRCPPADAPSTQAEAQATYNRTRWYFAHQLAFSKLVPEAGADTLDNNNVQAFLQLTSGTRITYTEFPPSSGIKAFHGLGRLESLPELASPVYRLENRYTAENPDAVMVVGFCGERMFRVEARGTNQQPVLQDAISLATNALASLRNQARYP
jgi:hypothetical protein